MVGTVAGPLSRSFEQRIRYVDKWPALFSATAVVAIWFLVWDAAFVWIGAWGFNPRYIIGPSIFGLPFEEILFFFAVPYACLFLYETTNFHIRKDIAGAFAVRLAWALSAILLIAGFAAWPRTYTCSAFLPASALLAYHAFRRTPYLGRFWVGFAASLVPFFLVNGALTGAFTPDPIVWYGAAHNLGIRLGTIPIEDTIYMLLHLLSITTVYEHLLVRGSRPSSPACAHPHAT